MAAQTGPEEITDGWLYQVPSATDPAGCRALDVLRRLIEWPFCQTRRAKIGMLAVCLITYLVFHRVRLLMPEGFLRSSLPSMLVMPVMLGVTDLFRSIRFHSWGKKATITLAATVAAVFWFEWAVPGFYPRSTADRGDMAAMLLGWLLYLTFDWLQANKTGA